MDHLFSLTGKKDSVLTDCGYKSRTWITLYTVSICFHLFFFMALISIQNFTVPEKIVPAIQVSLVPLVPAKQGEPVHTKKKSASGEKNTKKSVSQHIKKGTKTVSKPDNANIIKPVSGLKIKPEKTTKKHVAEKPKVSLKRKTYRPDTVMANARNNIKKSLEKKENNSLDKAFKRLEKKVREEGNSRVGVPGKISPGSKFKNNGNIKAIDLYNMELMYRIQQNWAFNDILAGQDKHLEVRVIIKIMKDGNIRDIWFETRSGNRYLDESALRAIKKSVPLPELPMGYSSYDIGLIFTPSGLK